MFPFLVMSLFMLWRLLTIPFQVFHQSGGDGARSGAHRKRGANQPHFGSLLRRSRIRHAMHRVRRSLAANAALVLV
jgi:hypothetical protein